MAARSVLLVGEENRGLEYMFIMMNAARFGVGMQGVAVAERAYQKAVQYAKDRVQSRDPGGFRWPCSDYQSSRCTSYVDVHACANRRRARWLYAGAAMSDQSASRK